MPNRKISELAELTGNVQNDDLFVVVDTSDTAMSPQGTNKKVTYQGFKADLNDTYLRLNGANGPLTGDIDTQNILPDSATAQIGTEQAPYQEVNAGRFKMPSDPGGYWALEKSANPGNVLNFVRNDGAGDAVPYTLNPTGTPASATDLATKAYVDAQIAGGSGNNDFFITKAPGNTGTDPEVGDKVIGWVGNTFVAGLVLNVPITQVSDLNLASQGQIIP